METRACVYCGTSFTPNKYSPRQKVCSNPVCQKKRQLDSMKVWREKYPNYFKYDESKGPEWVNRQRQRSKVCCRLVVDDVGVWISAGRKIDLRA